MQSLVRYLRYSSHYDIAKYVFNYILSSEHFTDKLLQSYSDIINSYIFYGDNKEVAEARIYFLEYLLSNKKLSSKPEQINELSKYLNFYMIDKKETAEAMVKVLDYISQHSQQINDARIFSIAASVKTMQDADSKIESMSNLLAGSKNKQIAEYIPLILKYTEDNNQGITYANVVSELIADKNFQQYKTQGKDSEIIEYVLSYINKNNLETEHSLSIIKTFISKPYLVENMPVLLSINSSNEKQILDLIKNRSKYQIPREKLSIMIYATAENIALLDDYKSVLHRHGYEKIKNMDIQEFVVHLAFNCAYKKNNLNELSMVEKKTLLKHIMGINADLFTLDKKLLQDYPLVPTKQEEYCDLVPSIVRLLGIDTKRVHSEQIQRFNTSLSSLAETISKVSDKDYADLSLTQSYPKDKFIKDVLYIVKDLSRAERNKVYDYFGFELHHNNTNETGFSITGYPVNLNNGEKLAQIHDPQTREVIEKLRPYVVKFSERNKIKCNNPQIEELLNSIVEVLPEIRTSIGKIQHRTQKFDIAQHSLKVLQKISQDSGYKKLNESDKKIMLLAALLHDNTKAEGSVDPTHSYTGSFDAYYIGKKLRLTEDECIKLYTLLKHHEWLEFANTARDRDGKIEQALLTKRLQSIAYDLQYDNLFDMALMFTHADLRAVKTDDSFHDTTVGKGRTNASGKPTSYGSLADSYAKQIKKYIFELKASQPLLPHTTTPKASKVKKLITKINPDGSTNLKGIYVDPKDGLIILKFNEADHHTWEALGYPKGTSSRKDKINIQTSKHHSEKGYVGNINFIVHGLDYENQLMNFDAFALKDSEALLSVSYSERPREKFRFFRAQGVTLRVPTKYIHGGGKTDSGSGCKKTVDDFKNNYIFGGIREEDRTFFSELVKEATGMSDKEYIKFVQENANKAMYEIEPPEVRDKIINIYAEINSRTRKKGNRSYNECYVSNAEAAAPFAYPEHGSVDNPVEFLNKSGVSDRTSFLRKYAHQNDEMFIVFGD